MDNTNHGDSFRSSFPWEVPDAKAHGLFAREGFSVGGRFPFSLEGPVAPGLNQDFNTVANGPRTSALVTP